MNIKNVPEFARYCQEKVEDATVIESIDFAERLADLSVALGRQYGGPGTSMSEFVGLAFNRLQADGPAIDQQTLTQTHEILTRFWEHGDAFDTWFTSKVIVVPA